MSNFGFSFYCPTHVTFGQGISKDVIKILKNNAWQRVGLVVDHNLRDQRLIIQLINSAKERSKHTVTGWCEVSEPTYDDLESMRNQYMGQDLDAIIGIGGGSALDMSKAMETD